ncbi:MAG: translocation/assembly module TamB [Bacteroidetes bacterium]|nr:translocation/assembly module TamB [Bacteroidota bacterium]
MVDKVVSYISDELETEIKLGGININIYLDIILEDVTIYDRKGAELLNTSRMVFDMKDISFRNKKMQVDKLLFDKTFLNVIRYEDENVFNFQFLADYFSSDEPKDTLDFEFNWKVVVKTFEFRKSGFVFDDRHGKIVIPALETSTLDISDFNLLFSDITYNNDTISVNLQHFSFFEQGGFTLNNFSGLINASLSHIKVENLELITPNSDVLMNASLSFADLSSFSDFINEVSFNINLQPSKVNLSDVAYFVDTFKDIKDVVLIEGAFAGKISRLRARDVSMKLGKGTVFSGSFNFNGLPYIEETFMNLSIKEFKSNVADIKKYYIPLTKDKPELVLPSNVDYLGNIDLAGSFTGFINDFVAFGKLKTDVGSLSSDIVIKSMPGKRKIAYNGKLNGTDLNIGKILEREDELGMLTFTSTLKGSGVELNNIDVEMNGNLVSLGLLGYDYNNIALLGNLNNRKFNGAVLINDDNIKLGFNGLIDFQDSIQHFDFNLDLEKANLTKLNVYQRDPESESLFSTMINMKFSFSDMENGEGEVFISNANYKEINIDSLFVNNEINIKSAAITSKNNSDKSRTIDFDSDILSAGISGTFAFADIVPAVKDFVKGYMPAWFDKNISANIPNGNGSKNGKSNERPKQNIDFNVDVKNIAEILNVFAPKIFIAPGTQLNGSFDDAKNDFILSGSASNIVVFGNVVRNWKVSSGKFNNVFGFEFSGEKILLTDSIWIDNFVMQGNIRSDTLTYSFNWDNKRFQHKTFGNINGIMAFDRIDKFDLKFFPSQFIVNDSIWLISDNNYISVDSSEFVVNNFKVYKGNEFVSIEGVVSQNPDKKLVLSFNRFDIYNLEVLFRNAQVDFDGFISGKFILNDIYGKLGVEADVEIAKFGFNNDHLGDLLLKSIWDPDNKAFSVNMEVVYHGNVGSNKPVIVKGYVYPEAEKDNFDLNIKVLNLRLSIFERYLRGFASSFRGMATGDVKLRGPLAKPELSGNVKLMRTALRVDYLNVPYSFTHDLEIGPKHFKFEDIQIFDTIGNSGLASGIIKHNNFAEFELDVSIRPDRMILLNTRSNADEMFYGRAFATGIAHIYGPVNDIKFNISARTNRGTQLFLPVDYTGEVKENKFITFINRDTTLTVTSAQVFKAPAGITLNFDLDVTPDAEIQIIFDSQIGDIIRARGSGNINMAINAQGEFAMYGDYTIQEGDYLFTLQNLINKRFRIEQGGTIRWAGDPFDADINLKTVYRLRTSLYDLMMAVDSSDIYRKRVPVEVALGIGQTLFNPSIEFDIGLPGSDEATKEAVERLISTEQEMNRQVFSLLVLNRFLPIEEFQYTSLGFGVGTTSSELLSNQLSNWLSQISSEVDIGFNYRPGDEISAQEFEMALSTQLFDDRVLIDGNFGVAGDNQSSGQNQRTSNIIGDVNVEVKVTPEGKFRVKAFNRSNSSDVLNQNAPYTQGVGVFYRKEFDSFSELFKRSRKSKVAEIKDIEEVIENGE